MAGPFPLAAPLWKRYRGKRVIMTNMTLFMIPRIIAPMAKRSKDFQCCYSQVFLVQKEIIIRSICRDKSMVER
jgi:hypothetical protein